MQALCQRTSINRHACSARGVCIWDLSSRALCPPRMSTRFRFTREAFRVCLRELESSFRCMLPCEQDIYMYIHPTQPKTPRLHNYPQSVDASHDNWDVHFTITGHESTRHITSSLYAAFSSSFPLPCTQSRAKWPLTCPPFWLPSFMLHGPDPCPGSLGKMHKVCAGEAGLVRSKYVGVNWTM